jgi:hypothetical protein
MWTIDMNRCSACSKKDICPDRKMLLKTLSPLLAERNANDEAETAGGDGVIIVSCRASS